MSIFLINPFKLLPVVARTLFRGGYEAGRTTRASIAFLGIKSLTTTETASTNYAAFWQIIHDFSVATSDSRVQLFETSARQLQNLEPQDPTDAMAGGGMYAYAGGTNKTFQIQVAGETTSTQGYAGYALNVLQLDSSDKFQTATAVVSATSTTFATRVSVTITEPGDYLIIGSCELLTDNADARLFDGTTAYGVLADSFGQDATNYTPYFHMVKLSLTNQTISLQYRSNDGTTMSIRGASILALKLDKFENSYYAEQPTQQSTTSTTFTTAFSNTFNIVNPGNYHLLIGSGMMNTSSTALSSNCKLSNITRGIDYSITHTRESNATTEYYPTIVARAVSFTNTDPEIGWRYSSETATVTTSLNNMAIAILDTGIPAPTEALVGTTSSAGSSTMSVPSGLQEGDVLFVASHSNLNDTLLPTGFTNVQAGVSNSVRYRLAYKVQGATPDTSISGLVSTGRNIAFAFRGVDTANIFDVTPSGATTNTSGMPNSNSVTTVNNDTIIASIGYLNTDLVQESITPPVTYSLVKALESNVSADNGTLMVAYKELNATATEDPGAFGGDGTDSWVGITVALRKLV